MIVNATHSYEEMTPDKRPQDPHLDGTGCTFTTLEHGGHEPDTMPQAIRFTDADGKSCVYVPIEVAGKPVVSHGFGVANAHLIAAAPELYAALKMMLDALNYQEGIAAREAAYAALAKARPKQEDAG